VNHTCGETKIRPPRHQFVKLKRFDSLLRAQYLLFYKFFFLKVESQRQDVRGSVQYEKVPIGFSLLVVGDDVDRYNYFGQDCVEKFFDTTMEIAREKIDEIKFTNNFIFPTDEELKAHAEATRCEVCSKEFETILGKAGPSTSNAIKVYHHNHFRQVKFKLEWAREPSANQMLIFSTFSGQKAQTVCQECNWLIFPTNYLSAITLGTKNEFKYLMRHVKKAHGEVSPIKRKEGTIIGLQLRKTVQRPKLKFHFGVKFMEMGNFRPDPTLLMLV